MQNPIIPQQQKELIENEPIVFDLQLNEFGYPTNSTTIYPLPIVLRGIHWVTIVAEMFFILLNPPSLDYKWFDWLNLLILTLTNLAFFTNLSYFQKFKRMHYFHFDEEKIEYRMTYYDGKSIKWQDVRKVVIWTDAIEIYLHKSSWNPHTINLNQIAFEEKEVRLHTKLAIRALCIKLKIPCEERPDCKKEQELRRRIIKKNEKKGNKEK